jgi:FAD/FMN-containing dehydrogenase
MSLPAEHSLWDEFIALTGDLGVLSAQDASGRSCDPFREVPARAKALVRPASTRELSEVVALCAARGQPIVTHGGRTGVSGGAYVDSDDVIVSLERMNRIEEICPVSQLAVVEAGVTVEALQSAAGAQGLFFPIDLGSKGTATIGGIIATNAGGNRVLRWGMTRQNVLGLEAVLSDGVIVSAMNRLLKNNTGYDLKHVLIGTEGTLGIVSRAVVRLVPAPSSQMVAFVSVRSHERLLALLARARQLPTLSAFEVMWPDYYDIVSRRDAARRPVSAGQGAYVLIEAMGYDADLDSQAFERFLEFLYENDVVIEAVVGGSNKQNADLWRVRESADLLVKELWPFVSFDVSIDVGLVEAFIERSRVLLRDRFGTVRTATFGHLGDNNIHIAAHVGPDTLLVEQEVERCVFQAVLEYKGALTAEHGIGQTKRAFLPEHKHPGEMEMMRRLKHCLDKDRILNRNVMF